MNPNKKASLNGYHNSPYLQSSSVKKTQGKAYEQNERPKSPQQYVSANAITNPVSFANTFFKPTSLYATGGVLGDLPGEEDDSFMMRTEPIRGSSAGRPATAPLRSNSPGFVSFNPTSSKKVKIQSSHGRELYPGESLQAGIIANAQRGRSNSPSLLRTHQFAATFSTANKPKWKL
jgi:hypothetical protein